MEQAVLFPTWQNCAKGDKPLHYVKSFQKTVLLKNEILIKLVNYSNFNQEKVITACPHPPLNRFPTQNPLLNPMTRSSLVPA
jgi:hypothetical protein